MAVPSLVFVLLGLLAQLVLAHHQGRQTVEAVPRFLLPCFCDTCLLRRAEALLTTLLSLAWYSAMGRLLWRVAPWATGARKTLGTGTSSQRNLTPTEVKPGVGRYVDDTEVSGMFGGAEVSPSRAIAMRCSLPIKSPNRTLNYLMKLGLFFNTSDRSYIRHPGRCIFFVLYFEVCVCLCPPKKTKRWSIKLMPKHNDW